MSNVAYCLAIAIFMMALDISVPMMYSIFKVDKDWSAEKASILRANYKIVRVPRTIFLAGFIISIIFAPKGAENNPIYLSVFVALSVAYIFCAIKDITKAYARVK